jgi:hypothetical protein
MMQVQEDLMTAFDRNEAIFTRQRSAFRGFDGAGRLRHNHS